MNPYWGTISETEKQDWIEAAVLVPCLTVDGQDHLILTKRTEDVLHHKGQICFPGGACDPGDKSLWETALRETREELGLDPARVKFLKEMPRQYTPTGFRVTPFVGRIDAPAVWSPNPVEIAAVFSVPFSHLRDPANLRLLKKVYEGREFLDPHFIYEGHEIWGMTGRILCELFEINPY